MKQPLALLLDTTIWVDPYYPDRPNHQAANELLTEAYAQDADLYYSSHSIVDVFYLATNAQKDLLRQEVGASTEGLAFGTNETAWGCIRSIYEIATPIPISGPVLFAAIKMKDVHADFEDDVVLAAAQLTKVDFLVTNDRKLIARAALPALSAADMLAQLKLLH